MPQNITTTVNGYNKNKWRVTFSNIPNFTGNDEFDLSVVNNNVRGITIPDLSSPLLTSEYMSFKQNHPNPIGTRDLQTLTLEIQADDYLRNWHYFWDWCMANRLGKIARTDLRGEPLLRDNCIDKVNVYFYDNAKNVKSKLEFQRCFITSISNMDLKYGVSEHGSFIVTLDFEGIEWKLQNKLDPADQALEDPNR